MTHQIIAQTRRAAFVALAALIAAGLAKAAPVPPQHYTYRINDAAYGGIGNYSNTVEKNGDATTITTDAHIKVSALGIPLYRQDVSRIERWDGSRLVYFHGVTTENGKPVEVDGEAEGDHFIVTSPAGKVVAPATIRSANPWSAGKGTGDTILMPDTGLVLKMVASGPEETSIKIDRVPTPALLYRIDTIGVEEHYEVWMDAAGTPLAFSVKDHQSDDTFTIIR